MNRIWKILCGAACAFAFCFLAIGYAAVQDELIVNGSVSVEQYYLKYDFSAADTDGYTLADDGTLKIEEIYYDELAKKNYRVVTIADNGFSDYTNKAGVTALDLPDSLIGIGENAFSDFTMLSYVEFGTGFTEFKDTSFSGCSYLTEDAMYVPSDSLVVRNQLGADITAFELNGQNYTIELVSTYDDERGVVTSYPGEEKQIYAYATVSQSKFELAENGKVVDLIPTTQYTYATLDADNGLHIKNRYCYLIENDTKLVEADGTYTIATEVYALPSKNGVCIANLGNSTVPTGARTDGWDTTRSGNTFEVTITSVVVADPIKLQGNLANLFYGFTALETADLTNADFSAVNNLYEFFDGCKNLEVVKFDNNNINTSNVENMAKMFNLCNSLATLDLSGFDTQKNTSMAQMFYGCKALTSLNLSSFNTSNVTSMASMFDECHSLTPINLSNFDTSNVTNMSAMFDNCKAITSLDLSSFNTSKVTNMSGMFCACSALQSINFGSNFNTSNVTIMIQMFAGCTSLASLDVSQFNTSNVTDMGSMFQYCSGVQTLNLSNFDTSKVRSMHSMFRNCSNLTTLIFGKGFDTSAVTNMSGMFRSCKKLTRVDLSGFNTESVTIMSDMFRESGLTTLDLSNFDTYEVTDMNNMFRQAGGLTTIYVSDGFVVNEGVITTDMFAYCNDLKGGNGTNYATAQVTDGAYACVDGGVDNPGYFTAHKVDSWTDINDGRHHSGTCTIHTDEIILETHTFVNGVCSKCQNTCQHNIFHNWKTDEDGGTTHSRVCLCGNTTETGTHTYDRNYRCTECGQCDHNVKSWTSVDENTHSGTCTRSSCKAVVIRTHTYIDGKCTECEAEQVAPQIEVTTNLIVGLTMTCDPAEIIPGQAFTITLMPDAGYVLPDTVTVTINGEDKTAEVTYENGVITIPATLTTGNITISVSAEAKQQIVVTDSFADGLTATYDPIVPIPGQPLTVYLAGETFPEAVTVKIDGVEATTAAYDKDAGTIIIPGDLLTATTTSITLEAVEITPAACTCETKCTEPTETCEVCKTDITNCLGTEVPTEADPICTCEAKCSEPTETCEVCKTDITSCLGTEPTQPVESSEPYTIPVNYLLTDLSYTASGSVASPDEDYCVVFGYEDSFVLPEFITVTIDEVEYLVYTDGLEHREGDNLPPMPVFEPAEVKLTIPAELLTTETESIEIKATAVPVPEPTEPETNDGEETTPPSDVSGGDVVETEATDADGEQETTGSEETTVPTDATDPAILPSEDEEDGEETEQPQDTETDPQGQE